MDDEQKEVEHLILQSFSFLEEELNFSLSGTREESHGIYVHYTSESVDVQISYIPIDAGIRVGIIPKSSGLKVPIGGFDLQGVLVAQSVAGKKKFRMLHKTLKGDAVLDQVKYYSAALLEHCSDILRGDFAILLEVEKSFGQSKQKFPDSTWNKSQLWEK